VLFRSAVLQAANAYVSPDLVKKEPAIFDPDRVARENPAWMCEMIALHGPTHGEDYWRALLQMTLQAIITTPNYTQEDLHQVQRPTLVVQGACDRVNAPARHAQFIARHIPDAELWRPEGVGHNVHEEQPCPWVNHVLDFLARRGDDANDALEHLKRACYADDRETLFEVRAIRKADTLQLTGKVLTEEQREVAHDILTKEAAQVPYPSKLSPAGSQSSRPAVLTDPIHVLLTSSTPWALVNRAVSDLRREPDNDAERISQVLLGEAVRVLETQDGWAYVRLEHDGYLGWVHASALHHCDAGMVDAYHASCGAIVQAALAPVYATDAGEANPRMLAQLPFGVTVPLHEEPEPFQEALIRIHLPDGRRGWVKSADLSPLRSHPRPDAEGIARTLKLIRRFVGVPYLWGGRTPFGFDCSGLAQAFLRFMGVAPAPRDADQQFRAGTPIEGERRPGDLLFFGNAADGGDRYAAITHVAIALGEGALIHANGTAWAVSINHLDLDHPQTLTWLRERLVGTRRYTR
jgi:gamma-D-glutamyl-L-lysine dipeptidyl-peptidase